MCCCTHFLTAMVLNISSLRFQNLNFRRKFSKKVWAYYFWILLVNELDLLTSKEEGTVDENRCLREISYLLHEYTHCPKWPWICVMETRDIFHNETFPCGLSTDHMPNSITHFTLGIIQRNYCNCGINTQAMPKQVYRVSHNDSAIL